LLFYALHQVVTAAFDWENNPRRALAAVLAVAYVYCWIADRLWSQKTWRLAFIAVLAISCALAMADTLLHTPSVQYLSTGQAIQTDPKVAITFSYMRFDNGTMPTLMADETHVWHDLGRAQLARPDDALAVDVGAVVDEATAVARHEDEVRPGLARDRIIDRFSTAVGERCSPCLDGRDKNENREREERRAPEPRRQARDPERVRDGEERRVRRGVVRLHPQARLQQRDQRDEERDGDEPIAQCDQRQQRGQPERAG